MVYIVIAAMAGYVLLKLVMFIRNRSKMKSMEEMDAHLISLINEQGSRK